MGELYRLMMIAVMIFGVCLVGCSQSHTEYVSAEESVSLPAQLRPMDPIVPDMPSADASESHTEPESAETVPQRIDGKQSETETVPAKQREVDMDFTKFNPNMLYAEVYHMGMSPEDYKGKVIKLSGIFVHFPRNIDKNGNPISDEEVYVCIISDTMACCATGIEFIPEKGSSFWTEYPEEGSKITVTGLCDIFLDESGCFTVIQLDNATVELCD